MAMLLESAGVSLLHHGSSPTALMASSSPTLPRSYSRLAVPGCSGLRRISPASRSSSNSSSSLRWASRGIVCEQQQGTLATGMGAVTLHNLACSQSRKAPYLHVSAEIKELTGAVTNVQGLRFAMVVGRFNEFVTRPLVAGALGAFKTHLVKESDIDIVWVPGSFEIPIVAQTLAKTGKYHAVLCIGTVIRGETTHYEAVANSAASGVLSAGLNSGVPCIFGVLTCETLEQALHRAGGKAGNKGAEAAVTAIEMASLFQHHLSKLKSDQIEEHEV